MPHLLDRGLLSLECGSTGAAVLTSPTEDLTRLRDGMPNVFRFDGGVFAAPSRGTGEDKGAHRQSGLEARARAFAEGQVQ